MNRASRCLRFIRRGSVTISYNFPSPQFPGNRNGCSDTLRFVSDEFG
ncbi:hypothetical protein E2C01_102735 [Portunus trituberculatus]|uniref:Uncharacterized protein n=1 Tax=Portunus trituberculatus TaxID=210409 RepID=A0A5B7K8Z8_PORTR|nr:hypothetical protein [Portunus trituberculatus]